jgi:chromosome partitioning protein
MHIIVLASQKGGSGKTTLSGHLAVEAEKSGAGPVVLIDTDPQGSLSHWWNARASGSPAFARVAIDDLDASLAELARSGARLAIIDTPPAITHSISQVVAHADLVLIPARPSPHDLRAVGATIDIAELHKKPLIFVVNAATARARITGEAAVALSQHGMVAPVTLHHRVDFAASMVDGKTIGEIDPKCRSAREVSDLWAYVAARLARITGSAELARAVPAVDTSIAALSSLGVSAKEPEKDDDDVLPEAEPEIEAEVAPEIEIAAAAAEVEDVASAIQQGASIAFVPDRSWPRRAYAAPLPPPQQPPMPPPPGLAPRNGGSPDEPWDGVERRRDPDGRPPPGMPDRRMNVFGRRRADQIPGRIVPEKFR